MSDRSEWFTASDLAALKLPGMPGSDRGVQLKAERENWASRPRQGRGGGSEYHLSALPEPTRVALAASHAAGPSCPIPGSGAAAGAAAGEMIAREISQSREQARLAKEEGLAKFQALSEARQQEARAKLELIQACDAFIARAGISNIKTGSERFSTLYMAGQIHLPEWVNEVAQRGGRISLSWASLHRWRKAYTESGLIGLVNGWKSPSKTSVPEDIQAFVQALVIAHPHIQAKKVVRGVEARFDGRADMPSATALRRYLNKFQFENEGLLLYLGNPDAWKNRKMFALGDASAIAQALNQLWEMDSTPTDLMLTDGRHTLIGCLDVWSRRFKLLVAPTSKGAHVAALIRRCLLHWGVPTTIKTDNGADYVSQYLTHVIDALDIEQVLCPPFTPEAKPHVERAFRTFSHSIVELLPGYIGHNVADRKAIEGRKSFAQRLMKQGEEPIQVALSAAELQSLCDRWTEAIYHQDVHSTLGMTPADKIRSWTQPVRKIADERALDMLLMTPADGGWRTVSKKGVRTDHGTYIAAALPDPGTRVRVLEDPIDWGTVYLYGEDGKFLCKAEDPERTGIDRAEVAAKAKANQKKAMQEGSKILKKLAREAKADTIYSEILAHREAQLANVYELQRPSTEYTTNALEEAARAAGVRDREAPRAESRPEVLEAQRRIEEEFAAEEQTRTTGQRRKVESIMSPQKAFARWKDIEFKKVQGLPVGEKDQKFFVSFVGTPDYIAMRKMEEDFGPACYQGF
ncbi:DNA-binding protein [Pseudomonas sp.]|uniref:DNA-binding protein n=1 Tax=Pseudomonas sp. TaxID=306 RepID=UPI003D0CBF80